MVSLGCKQTDESTDESIVINLWYGDSQSFGHLGGHPQRWINVLGNAAPFKDIKSMSFSVNGGKEKELLFDEDKHRLARPGDFNVEILRSDLNNGTNTILISATDTSGRKTAKTVEILYNSASGQWPLPYSIDWSKVDNISEVAQVVDGKWELSKNGVRSVERYYDRVIAFGDESWKNYEVTTTVTFHSYTPPKVDPNITNVSHAAIASRWPGHDPDHFQPTRKWHPLGATAEFRISKDLQEARWRIFDGQREFHVESTHRRSIDLEKTYHMKHRVETLADGRSRYRVKLWPINEQEPNNWDLERFEPNDLQFGSVLLLAHHTEVTFGNVLVTPVLRD